MNKILIVFVKQENIEVLSYILKILLVNLHLFHPIYTFSPSNLRCLWKHSCIYSWARIIRFVEALKLEHCWINFVLLKNFHKPTVRNSWFSINGTPPPCPGAASESIISNGFVDASTLVTRNRKRYPNTVRRTLYNNHFTKEDRIAFLDVTLRVLLEQRSA